MKIALLTASIGGYDEVVPPVKQTVGFDYYCYTQDNLPFPLAMMSNRLKSRYLKILAHRFLPDYDVYVWIDGRYKVVSDRFVETFVNRLEGYDVVMTKHGDRNTIYDELDFILSEMRDDSSVLYKKLEGEPFDYEYLYFKKLGVPAVQLPACGAFARRNDEKTNKVFDDWFLTCIELTGFDQTEFAYMTWKHNLKMNWIPFKNEYLHLGKHR